MTGFEIVLKAKHWHRDGAGFGAGEADYADASAAGGSCDGDDCVVQIQEDDCS